MPSPLVVLKTYSSIFDARLAQSRLQAAGIPAFLPDENVASIDPLLLDAIGGVKLQVRQQDAERATELLDQPPPDDGEIDEPACPRCESPYWSRRWTNRERVLIVALLGLPLLWMRPRLVCHRCAHAFDTPAPVPAPGYRADAAHYRSGNPVFFLSRSRLAAGAVAGLVAGMFTTILTRPGPAPLVGLVLGAIFGSLLRYRVCSAPTCRAPLSPSARRCPRCRGTLEGSVDSESEHWVRKAEWHRLPSRQR